MSGAAPPQDEEGQFERLRCWFTTDPDRTHRALTAIDRACELAPASAPTKSLPPSVRVAWARSTRRVMSDLPETWPSSCWRRIPPIRLAARERFKREAQAVAALQHPNICTIYDVGETADGRAFIVMELLQGETLQQRIRRGPLDQPVLLEIGAALADALQAAHSAGIVHRDIKPANILLTSRGPKILDFGLVKADPRVPPGDAAAAELETRALLTDAGSAVGTLAYMSPEQLRGEEVDARTDLFSFGLVLYEMAAGRPAFAGSSAVVGAAILHQQPTPLRTIRPDLPEGFEQVVLKALEKDRHLRYQTAADVRADLQRQKRSTDQNAAAISGPRRRRRRADRSARCWLAPPSRLPPSSLLDTGRSPDRARRN